MKTSFKTLNGFLAIWMLVVMLMGSGAVLDGPSAQAGFVRLKTADRLIGPPRGNAAGVYRFARAVGSNRIADTQDYIDEIYRLAPLVGLDPAILIAQSALETGYWKGKFWRSSLNPAGIGIYNDNQPHSFYWATGVDAARGHIYHLYTYAAGVPESDHILHQYRHLTPGVEGAVRRGFDGTRQTIQSLEGSWALMSLYALGLCNKGNEILNFIDKTEPTATPTATATTRKIVGVSASAGNDPGRTVDGNLETSWAILGNGNVPAGGHITYDLGAITRLSSVHWAFRRTGASDYLSIRGSIDGSTWTTLRVTGNAQAYTWQSLATTATVRYVRFQFRNPNGDPNLGYLAEVRFAGYLAPTPTPVPTATETPFVLSGYPLVPIASGGSGGASPSKNIRDGNLDTDWRTLSNPAPVRAFVYLDLGGTANVTGARWYLSSAGCGATLTIEGSLDKSVWSFIASGDTSIAWKWQGVHASATTRYIRFVFREAGSAQVLGCLAETEVWVTSIQPATPTVSPSATSIPIQSATLSETVVSPDETSTAAVSPTITEPTPELTQTPDQSTAEPTQPEMSDLATDIPVAVTETSESVPGTVTVTPEALQPTETE